jgi:hypothetical protein
MGLSFADELQETASDGRKYSAITVGADVCLTLPQPVPSRWLDVRLTHVAATTIGTEAAEDGRAEGTPFTGGALGGSTL